MQEKPLSSDWCVFVCCGLIITLPLLVSVDTNHRFERPAGRRGCQRWLHSSPGIDWVISSL